MVDYQQTQNKKSPKKKSVHLDTFLYMFGGAQRVNSLSIHLLIILTVSKKDNSLLNSKK